MRSSDGLTFAAQRREDYMTFGPVLIDDLIGEGKLLWAWCRDCERDLDPSTIPLPGTTRGSAKEIDLRHHVTDIPCTF